jgi:Uma2 family endonuclease
MSAQPVDDLDSQDLALAALMHLARRRPLTVADIEDLDPRVGRVELIDGNLILTPNPDLQHQDLCVGLTNQLNSMVPAGLRAYTAINVYDPRTDKLIFIPDVAVVDPSLAVRNGAGVFPHALALVIEITSSNRETELGLKKDWYTGRGIPYLVVDCASAPHQYRVFGDLPEWAADLL